MTRYILLYFFMPVNNFKVKKIRRGNPKQPTSQGVLRSLIAGASVVLIGAFIYYVGAQIVGGLSGTRAVQIFSSVAGKELKADERNHTNILLMGVGGEGHDGKNLTDTIILASLDNTRHTVAMVSVPRDLYIKSSINAGRVNKLYDEALARQSSPLALEEVRGTLSTTFDIPIHYYAKVDFAAFEKIVDSVGGIDVYVENAINDPFYPKGETIDFETFILPQGMQHLDGETALKYVRSRKTSSDFDRSKRQQGALVALKEKAHQENKLNKATFLKNLYTSLSNHVETDLTIREIISLADFATQWDSTDLTTSTLNDDPTSVGGFLYTPMRELFGGAFVLLPASDKFTYVNQYLDFVLYGTLSPKKYPVAVLNGTKRNGLASTAAFGLTRYGIEVSTYGNARIKNLEQTTWYLVKPEAQPVLDFIQKFIPGVVSPTVPPEYFDDPRLGSAAIMVELGKDAQEAVNELDIFSLVPVYAPTPAATETTTSPVTGTSTPTL